MNFTSFPNRTSADLQVHAHKRSHHFYHRIFTYKRYCYISFEVGFPAKIVPFFAKIRIFRKIENAKISRKNAKIWRKIHEKMQIFHEKMRKLAIRSACLT